MSHAGHKIVRCDRCGIKLMQCRCIEPKPTEWRAGPCRLCYRMTDEQAQAAKEQR